MSEIDWGDEKVLQPLEHSLYCFLSQVGLSDFRQPGVNGLQVFVSDRVLKDVLSHVQSDLRHEQGGVLIGYPYWDRMIGISFVDVIAAIPALGAEGTPVHLQFTSDAWAYMSRVISEHYEDCVVVGWYHSHPGLGIFFSGTDRATHRSFFNQPWSVALVVDPVRDEAGWFIGSDFSTGMDIVYYRGEPIPITIGKDEAYVIRILTSLGLMSLAAWIGYWFFMRKLVQQQDERGQ
jgi:proteasome lid subunit RPN8/RPN11